MRNLPSTAKPLTCKEKAAATTGLLSVDLSAVALPVGLAETELLQLARRRAGEGLAELHPARALEVRQIRPAVLDQLGFAHRRPLAQDDEGEHGLAPLLVGHADDGRLGDRRVHVEGVLHLDGGDVLPTRDDHVLLAVRDDEERAVHLASVARVEPAVDEDGGGLLGLVPVPGEDVVRARQHLSLFVDPNGDANGRETRPGELARPLGEVERIPLRRGAVDREQRRRLGEPVDLDELPPELALHALDHLRGGRGAGDDDANRPGTGHGTAVGRTLLGGRQDGGHDGGRPAHEGDAVALYAGEDLLAVHLAQHDMAPGHAPHGVGHPPPVAVEHRQRVEQDVPVGDAGVPSERHGVQRAVAMRQLHTLRARRRAGGVVHRAGGVLVRLPALRLASLCDGSEELAVRLRAVEHDALARRDARQCLVELGIDEQHLGAGVLDDEGDLARVEPVVDRDESPPRAAHPEEAHEEAGGVRADDAHSTCDRHAEVVESRGHPPCPGGELAVGHGAEARRHARLVDDCDPLGSHEGGPVEEVGDGERNLHGHSMPQPFTSEKTAGALRGAGGGLYAAGGGGAGGGGRWGGGGRMYSDAAGSRGAGDASSHMRHRATRSRRSITMPSCSAPEGWPIAENGAVGTSKASTASRLSASAPPAESARTVELAPPSAPRAESAEPLSEPCAAGTTSPGDAPEATGAAGAAGTSGSAGSAPRASPMRRSSTSGLKSPELSTGRKRLTGTSPSSAGPATGGCSRTRLNSLFLRR